MSMFDRLNARPNTLPTQQQSVGSALNDIKRDPTGFMKQKGLNVPDGMTDPQQMVNYLLNSGQISNPRLQMARQMMARMGVR